MTSSSTSSHRRLLSLGTSGPGPGDVSLGAATAASSPVTSGPGPGPGPGDVSLGVAAAMRSLGASGPGTAAAAMRSLDASGPGTVAAFSPPPPPPRVLAEERFLHGRRSQQCRRLLQLRPSLMMKHELQSELSKVKKTMKELFAGYCSQESDSRINNEVFDISVDINDPWANWNQLLREHQRNQVKKSELDKYLKDKVFPQEADFDILLWWKTNAAKYPLLSRIARDVLAVPASTVASESAFSTGGQVVSDYRSRLTSETVEGLICLQDWMRPFGYTNIKTITSDIVLMDDCHN